IGSHDRADSVLHSRTPQLWQAMLPPQRWVFHNICLPTSSIAFALPQEEQVCETTAMSFDSYGEDAEAPGADHSAPGAGAVRGGGGDAGPERGARHEIAIRSAERRVGR